MHVETVGADGVVPGSTSDFVFDSSDLVPDVTDVESDIQLALADIDSDDTQALYERCGQILDDIHSDRF